jgi:hypothetical protein
MTVATGSRHDMSYILEAAFGVTPATTPELKPIRHTGTTLGLSKDAVESEELRQDRQVSNFRHGNRSVGGDINFELSYGSFDDLLEATLCGTWAADVLLAGVTRRSYSIERYHADITKYLRSTGCNFNSMSLSVAPNSMITGSFNVIGKDLTVAGAILTGATYAAETTTQPFDSFTGSITEAGSTIATITSLDLTLDNGVAALPVVGSDSTIEPSIGKSTVTGTLTAYFTDSTLVEKFIAETASSIVLVLTDLAGNSYTVTLPNIKYNTGNPEVSGPGAVTVAFDFIALYDASTTAQIKIERAAA